MRFQFGGVSPKARIQDSKNEGVEMGEASFTISTSDPVVKFLLPVSTTIYSTALEFLVLEKKNAYTRNYNNDSTELEFKTVFQPLWVPRALIQQENKVVLVWAGTINPNHQG